MVIGQQSAPALNITISHHFIQGKTKVYCNGTLPARHQHRGRSEGYSPVSSDETAIYAKVDKGKKSRQQRGRNVLNISSDSSVETPLVTSEDGRSSANSEESKYNGMKRIKYDDRESRV